tara:strand:+ start:5051 stop:5791 length:741 start_codon:yes stop_codon:yes gene_type:complete
LDLTNQIELELYFADHFDTILFPVLAELYLDQNDLRRARKVCDIGLKYNQNDVPGLYVLAKIEKSEGQLKKAEKLLEKVLSLCNDHLAAAELLCEIQTVLGRATSRLLKSWKHVQSLDSKNHTANEFIAKVENKDKEKSESIIVKKRKDSSTKSEIHETKRLVNPKSEKESVRISTIQDIKDPLKVSSRLATFTLVSVLKNQGLFSQALEVLDALEQKGESKDSISLERDTIKTLIERSIKDEKSG